MGALIPTTAIYDEAKDRWYLTPVAGVPPLDTSKAQPYALVDYSGEQRRSQVMANLAKAKAILDTVEATLASMESARKNARSNKDIPTLNDVLTAFAAIRTDIANLSKG